jgi:Divergent InlB B-repeat domain
MKRSSTLLAGAMAIIAVIPELRADSGVQNVENLSDSALNAVSEIPNVVSALIAGNPANDSLTVKNGRPSGNYLPGTIVTVVADVLPGRTFSGWTGDVAILTNPHLPATTAMIPFTPVTIRASYTAPATNGASPPTNSAPATNAAPATSETPAANAAAPARKSISKRNSGWGG